MPEDPLDPGAGVSVVTLDSGRNAAWLEEAKQSVKDQVGVEVPVEHVVVENADRRFTIGGGYNEGVRRAVYGWTAILDDDDVLHPKALQMFVAARNELVGLPKGDSVFQIAAHQLLIDEKGEPIGTTDAPCQGMFQKRVVEGLGGYPEIPWVVYGRPNLIHSDMRLIITAVAQGWRQIVLPSTLYGWRIHRGIRGSSQGSKAVWYQKVLDNAAKGLFRAYNIGDDHDAGARYEGKMLRAMYRNVQFQNGLKYDEAGNVIFQPTLPPEEE